MEKPQQNESRKKLSDKLRGVRELDKDLAHQYLDKVSGTEDYKTNKEQTHSEFKDFKNAEKQAKIDAIKAEIENIGVAKEEIGTEAQPISEFNKKDVSLNKIDIGKTESISSVDSNKKDKLKVSPEGQKRIDALISKRTYFELQSKDERESIKQNYQKSCDSIDLKIKGANEKYKEACDSIDLKIKAQNDKFQEFSRSIDLKIKGANEKYKEACDSIDLKIKAQNEYFQQFSRSIDSKIKEIRGKQVDDSYQKEREIKELNDKKQTAEYTKNREIKELNDKKQTAGYTRNQAIKDFNNDQDTAVRTKNREIQDLNDNKQTASRARDREIGDLNNNKISILRQYEQNLNEARVKSDRILEDNQEKITQAKVDANPETLENVGPLENSLRDTVDTLIKNAKSEEDREEYQGFVSSVNNIKNLIKENKLKFHKETAYPPTIQNMNKYSDLWKEISKSHSKDTFKKILKDIDNPKKVDKYYGYLKNIAVLTPIQTKEILKAFGFGEDKQLRDIYEDYNKKHKSFFSSSVKPGKKHDFTMNSNNEGVIFRAHNYGIEKVDNDFAYFFADQKFIKELFENSKV